MWQWIFAISALILLDLIFVETVPRIVRQSRLIMCRLTAMAELPLIAQAEKAERDIARVNAALDALPALQLRARAALASIMETRFIAEFLRASRP
jgi:hypothetical protein